MNDLADLLKHEQVDLLCHELADLLWHDLHVFYLLDDAAQGANVVKLLQLDIVRMVLKQREEHFNSNSLTKPSDMLQMR